jgi:hypothetical protein
MSDSLTEHFMDTMASMMLARAMQEYEKEGLLLEVLLLLDGYGGAVTIQNDSRFPWYRQPDSALREIRERNSVAAVFATPARVAIHDGDGQVGSIGEMLLVYATHPGGPYRGQLMSDIFWKDGRVICSPRTIDTVQMLERYVSWLDEALAA